MATRKIVSKVLPTGTDVIDILLNGGYERDVISTVYGPAGSGKTLMCLQAAIEVAKEGSKVIYIDTEGGFSVVRLKQLSNDYKSVLENVLFLKPTNFKEQRKAFEKLKALVDNKIGLIVVDSIAMLYRLELGKNEDIYEINRALGKQISYLTEIARKKNIPILITNQVYSNFDNRDKVNMVGGDILKYGSKCLIELQIIPDRKRRAILKKHRSIPAEKEAVFEIKEKGIIGAKEARGFKLF